MRRQSVARRGTIIRAKGFRKSEIGWKSRFEIGFYFISKVKEMRERERSEFSEKMHEKS